MYIYGERAGHLRRSQGVNSSLNGTARYSSRRWPGVNQTREVVIRRVHRPARGLERPLDTRCSDADDFALVYLLWSVLLLLLSPSPVRPVLLPR